MNNNKKVKIIRLTLLLIVFSRILFDIYSFLGLEYETYSHQVFAYEGHGSILNIVPMAIITFVSIICFYVSLILFWFNKLLALPIATVGIILNFILNAFAGIYVGMPIEMSLFYVCWLLYISVYSISFYDYYVSRNGCGNNVSNE